MTPGRPRAAFAGLVVLTAWTACASPEPMASSGVLATIPANGRIVEVIAGAPHTLRVRRGEIEESITWLRPRSTPAPPGATNARAALAPSTVQQCRRGDDLVVHVREPAQPSGPARWEVLYFLVAHTLATTFESAAERCEDARAAAPTLDALLDGAAREGRDGACHAYLHLGRRAEALRCLMLGGDDPDTWRPLVAQIQSGAAEADLYRALAPSAAYESAPWRVQRVVDLLGNAPDRPRKVRWVREMRRACAAGAPVPCAPWRLRALGLVAQPLNDTALCNEVMALAEPLLAAEGVAAADRARELLQATALCGSNERRAPLLRRALTRPSHPRELAVGSTDRRVWNECLDDQALRTDADCASLPRWAGSWLSRHCDAAGVAAARAALGATPAAALDPVMNTIQDGALRVLGRCAPDVWRQVAGGNPDAARVGDFHAPVATDPPRR